MTTATTKDVALYKILVNGAELDPEVARQVREVRVVDYLQLPDLCTLQVGFAVAPQAVSGPTIDSDIFQIGDELVIRLGDREELTTTEMFKGEILTLEPEFSGGFAQLTVRAFDKAHHLNRSRRMRVFKNQTASDIVEKILKENGLRADCEASGAPYEFMQQDNETDWNFIWRLANRIGFEFLVEDDVGHFRKPSTDDPIELEFPGTLHSFKPRMTAVQQVEEVTLSAYDPKTKQTIEARRSSPRQIAQIGVKRDEVRDKFGGAKVHIATQPVHTQGEADAMAQALLDRLANGYIAAEGECEGNMKIKAGSTIRISGVGQRYSGTYRLQRVVHSLRGGSDYSTSFANSATHTVTGAVNGGSPPAIGDHLVIGIVTNNKDPEGMGRVKVTIPSLGVDHESGWARVVTPSAGNDRGMMMLPVKGEEVVVGFEHSDTTRAFVLGSLFNGKDAAGEIADTDGSMVIHSDQEARIRAAQSIVLVTDAEVSITASGDASIITKSDATYESGGKTALKTGGNLDITVGGNATIESTGKLMLKGMGVTIDAGPGMVQVNGSQIMLG